MKTVASYLIPLAVLALTVAGGYYGVGWAGNLAVFAVWLAAVLGVLVFVTVAANEEPVPQLLERRTPDWWVWTMNVAIVVALAAAGWLWTAGAEAFGTLLVALTRSLTKTKIAEHGTNP